MASRSDTVFPLIPAPMALAVDTLSAAAATTSRRSPAPSRATTTSTDRITTPNTPVTAGAATPGATTRRAKNPRHPIFNEDIFSRFYTTPFLVFHFAIYGAIPFYYLLHYSPFRDFGGGTLNHVVKWALFVLTQYITAVIVTSWNGRYRVQKDVTACALMLVGLAGVTGLKALADGMVASKG